MARRLRVMTYNIQGHAVRRNPRHLEQIAKTILDIAPDVAGLQEVHRGTRRASGTDQVTLLEEQTGMSIRFGRSIEKWGGEYGNAILTRGEFRSTELHPLPGGGEPRSMLECHLNVDGFEVDFLVAHLAAWFWLRRAVRTRQLAFVLDRLTSRPRPSILTGDFNTPPSSRELHLLMNHERLRECGDKCTPTHRMSGKQLDYIFSDLEWRTIRYEPRRIGPSDHWPLVAELELVEEGE